MPRLKYSRQCEGKVRHPSQGKAEAQVRSLRRISTDAFATYRCDWCGKWHVGRKKAVND